MKSIAYPGNAQLQGVFNVAQNSGQQFIQRFRAAQPINLMPGQSFLLPAAAWQIKVGRYSKVQYYDTNSARWRNNPASPGDVVQVNSDGTNQRVINDTGCPQGSIITNVGAGNATNGYNTVGVTVSAGSSTWSTLVGGSINVNVTITTAGNYSLAPLIFWTPAGNQTTPFIEPQFNCTIGANGNIVTVSCVDQGAGLTAAGNLVVVQQPGDTNPGGAVLTMNATLTNSGNLTALWPATPGANGNTGLFSLPTLTFNVGGGMAATVIMNWTIRGAANASNQGANYGASQPILVLTANAIANVSANALVANSVHDFELWPPRMAWLSGNSAANGTVNNENVVVNDAGFNLQAIPLLAVIPANVGISANISQAVFTAQVGGIGNDTSYIQAM